MTRALRIALALSVAFVFSLLFPSQASAQLEQAYQREVAFLEAERAALGKRLAQLEKESALKIEEAKAEVDQLQASALGISMQADRLTELLSDSERKVDNAAENAELVSSMLAQASATLEKGSISLPPVDKDDPAAELGQVKFVFENAMSLLSKQGQVRKTEGAFFRDSGERVEGTIVHVGQIASYGVSDSASGVLAPAGEGQLKLWPGVESAEVAQALASGTAPSRLKIFLYESLEKGVEKKKDKSAFDVVDEGGVIGWVIVACGLIALLLALMRGLLLLRAAANTTRLVERITPLVEKKELDSAIAICNKARSASGRVLKATLKNLHRERPALEDVITEAVLHEQATLDRFGSMIIVIAAVAPLLGLLGTVTGMIATFDIITEFGTGNPKLLSGGIAIALVTTELGLVVAIPALVLGNMLSGWAESIKDSIDKAALRITNIATGVQLSERPTTARPSDGTAPTEALPA